ncbi:MAG: endonuclease NucS [Candidatus Bathyarchaeota archaeon]|nr:endonuclease NucS [Candidatus Bathyarchaeota archaeon]
MSEPKKAKVLKSPPLAEAAEAIEEALSRRRTLIVAGRCSVQYDGRARSTLELGERLLIIKEDGALLVHRPVGYEPVNWQPSGGVFHVQIKDETVEVQGIRRKPRESVKVTFEEIFMVSALKLQDSGEFLLHATEQDMHRAILLKPDLFEEGFKPISWEKKVEPGFVDIYGEDQNGKLVIIEVKRKTATKEAAIQLCKYIQPIKSKINRELRGVLVAPSLGKDVQALLEKQGLEFKALDPKKCAAALKKTSTTKLETFFNQTTP